MQACRNPKHTNTAKVEEDFQASFLTFQSNTHSDMMQSSRRRTLVLVWLCVVGAASELVQVKRKRLLEFEVSWEAKAASR